MKHRITIAAGDLCYQSQVWVKGLKGDEYLVTGIVDKHELAAIPFEEGLFHGIYTHGHQAYTDEILGMAVAAPANQIIAFAEAPKRGTDVIETHFMKLKLGADAPASYLFFSGWELYDASFAEPQGFEAAVKANLNKY